MIVKILLYVLFAVTISCGVIPYAAAIDYVEVLDNFKHKDSTTKLFEISGHISSDFANMTVVYPDESVVISSVPVTDRGYFQSFVMLKPTDPAGLYNVVIHPFSGTVVSPTMNTSFFLSDYDGMLDIHIVRNSVLKCKDSSKYCMVPAISHIPKSSGVRFFNDDYDNHQIKIGSVMGDLILPDGDSILYPQKTGTIEYNCVIHPWINGKLHVSDVPSIMYIDETKSGNTEIIPTHSKEDIATSKNNILQNQYNLGASCSMCYVGTVTKIVDGDTIYVDKKSVRLALVNTPEKRQTGYAEATEFVKNSCPIGSNVLVNVDDLLPSDARGVPFAQVTCGDVNINESLMVMGLAKMYDTFCTESEFMYETWATNNCDKENTPSNILDKDINMKIIKNNDTILLDVTGNIEIVSEKDTKIIYIIVVVIVLLVCASLLVYLKKNTTPQSPSFTNIEYLE